MIGLKLLNTDLNAGCRRCRQQVGELVMRVDPCPVVVVMVHVTAASGARQVPEQDVAG